MAYRSISLFITLLWFLLSNPCYSETDTLHQGQVFKDWDELISSNKVFCLKFFSFGTMVSPYLGVFYNKGQSRYRNSDYYQKRASDDPSAVWVANRNNPIPDIYGKLIIDAHGKFSILSGGGNTVLDLFNPTTLVTRNASVTLLDSGNLVLQEILDLNGSAKRVLWQSFDYPTDTLLPGMKFGINLKTGHRWSLTSWRNDELPAQGLFTLDLDETGQMVILREGNVHWVSGPWQNDHEFKNTDLQSSGPDVRLYYVSNETEQSFTYLTRTYDSNPGLRMYQDGQLQGSPLKLNLHCISIGNPLGCAEDEFEKLECRKNYYNVSTRSDKYYTSYSYVDEYVYDERYNLYDCQRICWKNCSCVAYTTIRNRVGCKTYGRKVFLPRVYIPEIAVYYTINRHEGYYAYYSFCSLFRKHD